MKELGLRDWLLSEAEEKYRAFSMSLLPNVDNVLGIRLPKLRKKAKEIAKISPDKFLSEYDCLYFEEILLKGFVIGNLNLSFDEHWALVKEYVALIDNWSVCDSFCASLKFINSNKFRVWEELKVYLNSSCEFELRFAVVIILNYFLDDEWIDKSLEVLFSLDSDKYYAQMGIAWAISICLMKYFDKTYDKLLLTRLPLMILKKSIQKGCDSYRLTDIQKQKLKNLL